MNVLERFTGKMSFELDLKEQSRSLTSKKKKKLQGEENKPIGRSQEVIPWLRW